MPNIYKTVNIINATFGIKPFMYIGSDQHDNHNYFGSSKKLKNDVRIFGSQFFEKQILQHFDNISNLELRKIEEQYLKSNNVKNDPAFYNKIDTLLPGQGCGVKGMKHRRKYQRSQKWIDSRTGKSYNISEETRKRWSAKRTGVSTSDRQKTVSREYSGSKHASSKCWELTDSLGNKYIANEGLRKWCRDRNINYLSLYQHHNEFRNWSFRKLGASNER